ncbi:MAG: PAS domain S-box protein [Spirochaetaceae bacterium]
MSKKILLVEDEAIIALSEAKMLEKHGYRVATAYTGRKAVEAVDSDPEISLILMDIDLGKGMDGTEAAETILARHDLPVVFLSSHTEPEVVERTEGITSYGYIVKNSGETVLLASLRMAFRLYDAHRRLKEQKEELRTTLVQVEETEEILREREEMYRNLAENSIDAVQLLDEQGRFLDVNERGCEMIGYSREELLSMSIADIDPNYPADGFYRFWKEQPKGTSVLFETVHRHKDGTRIPVEVNGIFFEVNKRKYLFGVARDITERKEHERRVAESERNLRITLNSIGDGVIATDRRGRVVRINPVAEKLCGWPEDEAVGRTLPEIFRIVSADTRLPVANPVAKVMETGRTAGLANHTVLIARDGSEYQIADSAAPIENEDGTIEGVVLVFRDVSEAYESERRVRESAERLNSFLQHSPLLMSEIDGEGRYLRVNPALAEVLGASPREIEGKTFEEVLPPELAELFAGRVGIVQKTRQPVHVEDTVETDGGRARYITTLFPLLGADGALRSIGSVAHDITERTRAEEALSQEREFLSRILDTIDDAIVVSDAGGRITRFNEAARRLHGLPERPIPSDRWAEYYSLYRADGTTPLPTDEIPLARAVTGERVRNAEIIVSPTGRTPRVLRCNGNQLTDEAGESVGAVIVMHDVTDYREMERRLRDALRSKDSLMRELNHRVKNNLNILSSLVSLKETESAADLSDIRLRIDAIGLVHEKLRQYDELRLISVREYLQDLLEALFSSLTSREVRIVNEVEDIATGPDIAVPLGLIVNEVATNAIKHGFRPEEEARFTVSLATGKRESGDTLVLSNTGNPFPEELDIEGADTLGLQLITGLVHQLGGTIELQKRPYPVFTIRIPEGVSRQKP